MNSSWINATVTIDGQQHDFQYDRITGRVCRYGTNDAVCAICSSAAKRQDGFAQKFYRHLMGHVDIYYQPQH